MHGEVFSAAAASCSSWTVVEVEVLLVGGWLLSWPWQPPGWNSDIWLVALEVMRELAKEAAEQCEHIMEEVERRRLMGWMPYEEKHKDHASEQCNNSRKTCFCRNG